ncbi:MAG: putative DNA modification/repair radical SAM protein [Thermodesulfovibrio aggregans]|jgi:putative DNA modification/repair radical SAM protein|uniref:Putative DNA modification/repair radical SAM protein n=1 Tax=Thermodesulfovibrio aggregans TaxID=86166 RepID=A0A2J6WLF8_9BACT|nr:MAG: putative DNA modification/repair radical SAM protein [Thermodesulfovibrio aggregans]
MFVKKSLDIYEKLSILANGAKFDISCCPSFDRKNFSKKETFSKFGIQNIWTSNGRCIRLLKVLLTNFCINDCAYCINRKRNDIQRTIIMPEELARVAYEFYRNRQIEGVFLSSGIISSPDKTMQMMIDAVKILRIKYQFKGYIHLKIIPDSEETAIAEAVKLADRVSINLELPTQQSLSLIAPQKKLISILCAIEKINKIIENTDKGAKSHTTQLIVGATPDTDYEILQLCENLYKNNQRLKRVYFSAYIPVNDDPRLPQIQKPPILKEHRLYQADWLIRYYGFQVKEIVSEEKPFLNEKIDPKLDWALRNIHLFPVELETACFETILRVPGIGITSAKRILKARKTTSLTLEGLKTLGVVIKRAKHFITIGGKYYGNKNLIQNFKHPIEQYSLAI